VLDGVRTIDPPKQGSETNEAAGTHQLDVIATENRLLLLDLTHTSKRESANRPGRQKQRDPKPNSAPSRTAATS